MRSVLTTTTALLLALMLGWHWAYRHELRRLRTRYHVGIEANRRFEEMTAELLRSLPDEGPLFPYLRSVRAGDR